jgi:phosphoribosylformylglycinamidine cyclo-ligase
MAMAKDTKSKYERLGVDPDKKAVREIFGRIVKNDFPGAFVNIAYDLENPGKVFTKHPDGDGSKMVQRVLHYLETGEEEIFQGAVDDAFSMNTGDIAASGFVFGKWVITQVININGLNVPKDLIMKQIALRVESLLKLYKSFDFELSFFMGGETADLPDQVDSAAYDVDIYAEAKESELIIGNVKPGDGIYGFASDGQAIWEKVSNSGIMSNGLTAGRIYLMSDEYGKKYPFLIRRDGRYEGRFSITSAPDMLHGMTVSEAILSPTRQWAILIRALIERLKARNILHMLHGISMNTGGGATKIVHVGKGIKYVKNKMPAPPPIFLLIQNESQETWRNMYKSFNCGVGIDVVGEKNKEFEDALRQVSKAAKVKLYELGECYKNKGEENKVILTTPFGTFDDY